MRHSDSQRHQDMPKPSTLGKYKRGIFLVAIVAASLLIAFYLTRGAPQSGPKIETGGTPSTPVISATSTQVAFTSPVSPLSPLSPVPTYTPPISPLDPFAVESMAERGLQLYGSGDYQGALNLFNTIVEAEPRDPRAYDMRGTIYIALNDYEHALSDYNKAVELSPASAQVYYNRGRVYTLLKRYDEALSDLKKSAELEPTTFGYRANGNIGLIYYRRGEYDKALKAFETSMSFDKTKADTFYLRGETYTALENYQAAIADYEAAIARFSRYDLAYQSLGYAYYKIGQYDKASEALKQAIAIAPDSPAAHFYLALVDLATGDVGSATAAMSQAAASFPKLSPEDQKLIYTRVTTDLKTLAKQDPSKAAAVESMLKLMPKPQ